jgi:xanthine/CO dehydrogenase XdhC/CoxF family maturation factor
MNDRQIYEKAAQLLETGQNIALVTVISTTGSTPKLNHMTIASTNLQEQNP